MHFKKWLISEMTTDVQVGQVIEIPAQGTRNPFNAQVIKIQGDNVWMRRVTPGKEAPLDDDMAGGNPFKMSRAALRHWTNDLTGKVQVKGQTDDPWINKVLAGKAPFLGKGDDGVVFDAGEMVVKVSTTVPFHPDGMNQRLPSEAAKMLFMNARLVEQLRKQGVPGLLPTYAKIVGDKAFVVMPKVDIKATFTKEETKEVKASIEAIHAAGYSINDEIQVGSWNGHMYHFDLGKMAKISHKEDPKDDMDRFKFWMQQSGHEDPMDEWENCLNMLTHWYTDDHPFRPGYIRKLIKIKVRMDREYPERKKETQKEMDEIVDK